MLINMKNKNKRFVFHSPPTEHNTDRLINHFLLNHTNEICAFIDL